MQPRFKLINYFTATSLVAFAGVAGALIHFQGRESVLMEAVRTHELQMVEEMQASLVGDAEIAVQRDLWTAHQANNAHLARVVSNALWDTSLAPFLAAARSIDVGSCQNLTASPEISLEAGNQTPSTQTSACQQQGARLRALPAFAALDTRVLATLRDSSIVSIRIHDLFGNTLYATDHHLVGDNQSSHTGGKGAALGGQPISSSSTSAPPGGSHGASDARNVIVSQVPLTDPVKGESVAVFELRAKVTPHRDQMQHISAALRQTTAGNEARLAQLTHDHRSEVQRSERALLLKVAGLLVLLFAVLYSIVRRAQSVIEKQTQESDANKQRLAQSEKMTSLGQMVASVAHQLNTPLAFSKSNVFMAIQALDDMSPGIRSMSHVMDRMTTNAGDTEGSEPLGLDTDSLRSQLTRFPSELRMTQDMLGDVLMGLNQMNELVDNLRSFTRLDHARTAEVDINTTLSTVIYIAKAVISPKIRVVQKFSKLPRLECHVSQLNQVFLNLIMNAAQAIDTAGQITVSTATTDGSVCISIEDNGSGIPDEVLPRIFDPYFTTKPAGSGTGLGLAIARDIVKEHGGTLSVSTQVGTGTTFQIELPIQTGHPA